jgi:uncharacterized protein (DUF433 family)
MDGIAHAAQRLTSTKPDQAAPTHGSANSATIGAPDRAAADPAPAGPTPGLAQAPQEAAEFDQYRASVRAALAAGGAEDCERADDLAHVLWRACAAISEHRARRRRRQLLLDAVRSLIGTDAVDRVGAEPEPMESEATLWGEERAARAGTVEGREFHTEPFWRTRLTFETSEPAGSPLVRGTMVRALDIAALIRGGWSWRELLERFPELDHDDLRACISYAVEMVESSEEA